MSYTLLAENIGYNDERFCVAMNVRGKDEITRQDAIQIARKAVEKLCEEYEDENLEA